MKKYILIICSFIIVCALNSFTVIHSYVNATNGDLAIIINADNPVSTMTASQVKLTYLRKINKRWKEINKNVIPVDRKGDNDVRKSFLKDVVQMTSDEMTRFFTEREYQNAEAPPVKFSTDDEIINFVEDNVGAIGFVNKSSVKPGKKVKVVFSL